MGSLRLLLALGVLAAGAAGAAEPTPPGFTVAFLGDQGGGADARAVLELIRAEGADAVVHQGDFDYGDDPAAWDALITAVLGADFPYFASVGNHDTNVFYGTGGYQSLLADRLNRIGVAWSGDLGVRSTLHHQGLHLVLTAPGIFPGGSGDGVHDVYIREQFAASDAIWRISSWHKNQNAMQAGGKGNETGWGVYEESRRAGAIIATGHEHSYARTHLLAHMAQQVVASTSATLVLEADDPLTPLDEGRSFAFVSGLGGRSIRRQRRGGDWFARIHTASQGARDGALFGVFHDQGDPRRARFYFMDVDGFVADEFVVESAVGSDPPACGGFDADADGICDDRDRCPFVADPLQRDVDADGVGDACEAGTDDVGVVRAVAGANVFLLDHGAGDPEVVFFGDPTLDVPLIGDWDGSGPSVGVARVVGDALVFVLDAVGGPRVVAFGDAGDTPLAGDWDGDGLTEVGVARAIGDALYFVLDAEPAPRIVAFGDPALDHPIAGDWDGDGADEVGVVRAAGSTLLFLGHTGGAPMIAGFGDPTRGDAPLVGDWDGDGRDDPGVVRPQGDHHLFILDAYGGPRVRGFGDPAAGDLPIAGDWD